MTLLENVADRLAGGKLTEQAEQIADLQEVNRQNSLGLQVIKENMRRLEQAINSPEWRMLAFGAEQEFTRQGIRDITTLARIMRLKNPLIKRGVQIQRLYVWAQGVTIAARDPEINTVIQAFLDDERNRADLTSHQARGERERDLQTDGALFFRFFVNQVNGRVRVRCIDYQEIDDIICNPEDRREHWFYRRTYNVVGLDGSVTTVTEYYPDIDFKPRSRVGFTDRIASLGGLGGKIVWDTPVYYVAVNKVGKWGVSEFYDALDWALAYKNFLEQLASVWAALARWAAKLTTKGGARGVAAAKSKLGTTMSSTSGEINPPPVTGSVFLQSEGVDLQPFRTAGATMSAEDGRRLMLMSMMAAGFPETFYGDAKAGSLATAKSLDRPTELKIIDRQTLWEDIHQTIFSFVLLWAVKAPQGPLGGMGRVTSERDGDQVIERVEWRDGIEANVDMTFPAVIEHDVREMIGAVIDAQTLNGRSAGDGIPLETAVQQILTELGLQNVDEIMNIWRQDQEERVARAEKVAAQTQPADDMPDDGEMPDEMMDDETMESVWQRQVTAVTDLLTEIREANGHNGAD